MRESFLDRNRSVYSTNNESNLHVNLTQKARLYPFDAVRANIDKLQLYNEEKDASNNFRLIFTINPICSNVLFNMRTEVIKNEGSITDCVALVKDTDTAPKETNAVNSSPMTREQMVKDTEYSHPDIGQWVYHCGLDIFNNHKLRTNSFIYISKVKDIGNDEITKNYNTMWDLKRDKNGDVIEEVLIDGVSDTPRQSHVYQLDNIMTFQEAVQENLILRNGWYGFVNTGSIEIPNGKLPGISVNKIMNNNKACEIYNMYPDISLFLFVPKYNKYQQRKESNWDYCLTYPYLSDVEMFKTVNDGKDGILIVATGTCVINSETYNWYETKLEHNLSVGDYVRLYLAPNNFKRVRVDKIGDLNRENSKFIFMVNFNGKPVPQATYIKKDAMGLECKYYFRVFKKLRNIDETDFKSDLSRQAFGENIYGDRIAQLTFLDTVNLDNLVDNLGRPLSEIYLTVVKRNKGWEKWYKDNNNYKGEDIEFSHCFGPVTSGLDLLVGQEDYNVHRLHNHLSNPSIPTPKPIPKYDNVAENIITIDDEYFYGDIVEFNPNTFDETVISKVYHRFNTAQRELSDSLEYKFYNLVSDDYESVSGFTASTSALTAYKPEGYYYEPHYKIVLHNIQEEANRFLAPVVKPLSGTTPEMSSTGITLSYAAGAGTTLDGCTLKAKPVAGTYDISVTTNSPSGFTFEILFNECSCGSGGGGDFDIKNVRITAATDYDYYPGDVFGICQFNTANTSEANVYWGNVSNVEYAEVEEDGVIKKYPVLTIDVENWPIDSISVNDEFALTDGSVPQYAIYNPLEQTFIWKDVILPSETPSNASTYNMPFSNGAFYIHQNVTFFLRRQDPFGVYGLQDTFDYSKETKYEDETEEEFKQRVNPERYLVLLLREREVATQFLKFVATDIINNCL